MKTFILPADYVRAAIATMNFKQGRPQLEALHFESCKGKVVMSATDGVIAMSALLESVDCTIFNQRTSLQFHSPIKPTDLKGLMSVEFTVDVENKTASMRAGNTTVQLGVTVNGIDVLRVFPAYAEPSGEPAQFDPEVLLKAQKAARYIDKSAKLLLAYTGEAATLGYCNNKNILFLIMPIHEREKLAEYRNKNNVLKAIKNR